VVNLWILSTLGTHLSLFNFDLYTTSTTTTSTKSGVRDFVAKVNDTTAAAQGLRDVSREEDQS